MLHWLVSQSIEFVTQIAIQRFDDFSSHSFQIWFFTQIAHAVFFLTHQQTTFHNQRPVSFRRFYENDRQKLIDALSESVKVLCIDPTHIPFAHRLIGNFSFSFSFQALLIYIHTHFNELRKVPYTPQLSLWCDCVRVQRTNVNKTFKTLRFHCDLCEMARGRFSKRDSFELCHFIGNFGGGSRVFVSILIGMLMEFRRNSDNLRRFRHLQNFEWNFLDLLGGNAIFEDFFREFWGRMTI